MFHEFLKSILPARSEREDVSAIRKSVERTEYKGLVDSRRLTITEDILWLHLLDDFPRSPWMSVYLVNVGLYDVYVSVNYADRWGTLRKNDSISLDHSHARRKIDSIGFKCDTGESSTISLVAQY